MVRRGREPAHQPGLPRSAEASAATRKSGEVVVVEILEQPSAHSRSVGRVTEVLGSATDPGIEIEIALRKHALPFEFSEEATRQAKRLAEGRASRGSQGARGPHRAAAGHDRRRDGEGLRRRGLLRAQGQGLPPDRRDRRRLALRARRRRDRQGRARARHVGLLPAARDPDAAGGAVERAVLAQARRSTGCAWSATWTITAHGAIEALRVLPRGHALAGRASPTRRSGRGCPSPRRRRRAQAKALLPASAEPVRAVQGARRGARRSAARSTSTPSSSRSSSTTAGKITAIVPAPRNDAHKLIEECMLAANVCTADFLAKQRASGALPRARGTRRRRSSTALREFLADLGAAASRRRRPAGRRLREAARADRATGPTFALLQTVLLRSLSQAQYRPDNAGHFGLAYEAYAHFTSPIRRYPDLLVHRAIKACLAGNALHAAGHDLGAARRAHAR